ncbi:MAG: hypothetical protein ACREO1_10580 [Arenimonas sp.]
MFLKNSRYYNTPTVVTVDANNREVKALTLRWLPITSGERTQVHDHDQLDVMSHRRNQDGTKFWHIADANSDLEANNLVAVSGRHINVPEK